jgi:DNA repair exonuclease SbcCD nuclease subunit
VADCRQRGITEADILGDLINDKSIIYTIAQDAFKDFIQRNDDFHFRIISGNHDMSSTGETQKSAITVFDSYDNVDCIPYAPMELGNITYVPYCGNFLDTLKDIEPNDILISHLGLNEAMLQSGLSRVDKITLRDLSSKFKLAILGHYHKPQHLETPNLQAYYAGNIIHKDWNDKNEKKSYLIYDTETLEVEVIPITGFREFREYIIESPDQKDDILQQVEIARNQGHKVRIKNTTNEDISQRVDEEVLVVESREIDITNRGIEITQTREEQIKKYMEIKEIPEEHRQEFLDVMSKYNLLDIQGEKE